MPPSRILWRDTMRTPRLFVLPAMSIVPMLVAAMFWSWTSLGLALATTVVFVILERKGLSVAAAFRALRVWFAEIISTARPARTFAQKRRLIDHGFR